jgi:hypothetical protein
MLIEIIALFFLCRRNGLLAVKKGLNATRWKWYTIFGWFAAEIAGIFLGILLFGKTNFENLNDINALEKSNFYGLAAMGLISAFGGYLIVKAILENKPDIFDEDINKIGISDLQPPHRK